jgi:hypothetical protein
MVLKSHGPRVQVEIGIHQVFATQLQSQNVALPSAYKGTALVDTGASVNCVDSDLANSMGLPIVDVVTMASASHAGTPANVYPIRIELLGLGYSFDIGRTLGASLRAQGFDALIGRDILDRCTLIYSGALGQISLCV